jgi:G3E family GTPase
MKGAAGSEFIVLTGFLGTGKTTLLRDFLERPETADTAVIVNEVGEIGLDGALLRESGADAAMVMLSNGCICCQAGSDLALTVNALLASERPADSGPLRRIILETSGLSKPGPVLRQLSSLAEYRLRITVVATFDATRGTETAAFEEAVSQWCAAHRIVVTKADAVADEALERAKAEIEALNPLAEIVATADRAAAVAAAFAPLARSLPMPVLPRVVAGAAHPRIAVRLARPAAVLQYDALAAWLDNLAGALGDRLLRLKGLVRVAQCARPILVQSVGTAFSIPRPLGEPDSATPLFLVIIARDLEDAELDAVQPAGLFALSSWAEPSDVPRLGSLQSAVVGWI